jgi:multiple sugar transport system ATP-binding protein
MARVAMENVSKVFKGPKGEPVRAVSEVNLVVEDKELLVLVGPSGCGKSTVLRLIAGLEELTHGSISIDGRVVNDVPPKDRDVAMVFQNYALYPHMTVYENMAFGLKLRKFPRPEIEQRVKAAAELLGLMPLLDRLPKALSGGQRQRVAVGRALVRRPKAFLFDEPLSNLDAQMRAQMRAELSKLHQRLAATMIYVTHDQVEAMTMGDRIAVMRDGLIQQIADPMRLYDQPANLFVAGFIGSPPMNFFKGTISRQGETLQFVAGAAPATASDAVRLQLSPAESARLGGYAGRELVLGQRPEHIRLLARGAAPAGCSATVELVEPVGAETYVHLSSGGQAFVARVPTGGRVEVNQPLAVTFEIDRAHFFDPQTEQAVG